MFIEPNWGKTATTGRNRGWIEVITGCMFSGKTEELIRRINRALIANQKVLLLKPSLDTRYHVSNVVSHDKKSLGSTPVDSSLQILDYYQEYDVIGIDEAQFFDEKILEVCSRMAQEGKRIIVAGLDMDSEGNPFGWVPQLMAAAEFVTKLHAICSKCGNIASFTYRTAAIKDKILLGEKESYEARCRECFYNVEL